MDDSPSASGSKAPADSWEDTADASTASSGNGGRSGGTAATTPDEEDSSMETDAPRVPASKPKTKVKPVAAEATTTEKEHVNVVFIGHVDAGKSTIGGQIQKLTGMVDARTLEKYEREAKEKNRETWYLSWCMDTNLEGAKDARHLKKPSSQTLLYIFRAREGQDGGGGPRLL